MAQCQSPVFFPDDPAQRPQFNECPRQSQTTRRTWRFGDPGKGEPPVVNSIVKLCARSAKIWDEVDLYADASLTANAA